MKSLSLPLTISVLILLFPLLASAAVTYSPRGPVNTSGTGVLIYTQNGGWGNSVGSLVDFENGIGVFNLINDWKTGGSVRYGQITDTQIAGTVDPEGNTRPAAACEDGNDGHYITGGGADDRTVGRICGDLDTDMGPNPSAGSYVSGKYVGIGYACNRNWADGGDWAFQYCRTSDNNSDCQNGGTPAKPTWVREVQSNGGDLPSGGNYEAYEVKCTSYTLPSNTLQIKEAAGGKDAITITAGETVHLDWNDEVLRDKLFYPSGWGRCAPNDPPEAQPQVQCVATGFDLPGEEHYVEYQTQECEDGNCICTFNGGANYFADQKSGEVAVTPSQTTTYTYSCQGPNGTTQASVTVTVSGGGNLPDIVADNTGTPLSGDVNDAIDLDGTISNIGPAETGNTFPSIRELCGPGTDDELNDCMSNGTNAVYRQFTTPALSAAGEDNDSTGLTDSHQFTDAGKYFFRYCGDTDTSWNHPLNESRTDNDCGKNWREVDIGATKQPNLIADDAKVPGPVYTGDTKNISALVHNTGSGSTVAGFGDLFEIGKGATPPEQFSDLVDKKAVTNTALAAGGHVEDDTTYTFSSAGTWWVRLCANTDTNGYTPGKNYTGTPETEYDDNCSPEWTEVDVTDRVPVCSPSTQSGNVGDTISWNASNGTTYKWYDAKGKYLGSGTTLQQVYKKAGAYGVYVVSDGVKSSACTVNISCVVNPKGSLTASPTRVATGTPSTLSWSGVGGVPDGKSCVIESTPSGNGSGDLGTADSCSLDDGKWQTGPIDTQTKFCLVCGGQSVACTVVDVAPNIQEF